MKGLGTRHVGVGEDVFLVGSPFGVSSFEMIGSCIMKVREIWGMGMGRGEKPVYVCMCMYSYVCV